MVKPFHIAASILMAAPLIVMPATPASAFVQDDDDDDGQDGGAAWWLYALIFTGASAADGFAAVDSNGDGALDRGEVKRARSIFLKKAGIELTPRMRRTDDAALDATMRRLDSNGDGKATRTELESRRPAKLVLQGG